MITYSICPSLPDISLSIMPSKSIHIVAHKPGVWRGRVDSAQRSVKRAGPAVLKEAQRAALGSKENAVTFGWEDWGTLQGQRGIGAGSRQAGGTGTCRDGWRVPGPGNRVGGQSRLSGPED